MKRIIHVITGLGSGGAENMLYKLLKYSNKDLYYHEVISLKDEGTMGKKIKELGVQVHVLNFSFRNFFSAIIKIKKISKNFDIVNTWLYHADLLGFVVAKILSRKKLVWNIRHSNLDKNANKSRTLKIVKINSMLSKYVDCITYNSNQAFNNHIKINYTDRKSILIPNGFELAKFKFDMKTRINVREKLLIKENEKILITIGRWNEQKDYGTLIKALHQLKNYKDKYKLIMIGKNLDYDNEELVSLIESKYLTSNVLLLGVRDDIPDLLSAADIYISSSIGESFSNAIGEAMATELNCIVTDVGDSKRIVGNTGIVVDPQNYLKMSNKIISYITLPQIERNKKARKRVIENYDIKTVASKVDKIFSEL